MRAEELRLQREVEIADLVDEERAAVRLLEDAARARSTAPVNAPRSWPKSSDSTRFGGTAVQSKTTNGPARARPLLVERLGEHLLARAGLALDDDGDVDAASRSHSG